MSLAYAMKKQGRFASQIETYDFWLFIHYIQIECIIIMIIMRMMCITHRVIHNIDVNYQQKKKTKN